MITRLSTADYLDAVPALGEVLADCTNGGASVGFLAPLDAAVAAAWWKTLAGDVAEGRAVVWAACTGRRAGSRPAPSRATRPIPVAH